MSVVIETTLGDMTVDLFIEERPNTCLNFLKLCKIKYYNFCLFHTVQHNFIAQTGDPTGTGKNGESVYSKLYGEKAKYYEAEAMPKMKHGKAGLVSMVNCGNNMLGSQFFFTLSGDLQSLDGQHCVFGEVVEGHDTLLRLNETICDLDNRPYQDIRIKHTVILVDPYDDPPGLPVPDASPLPSAETLTNGRIGPDEQIDEAQGLTAAEVDEMVKVREAKAQATILEIVGDLPDADVAPPENVLFVCKLNPVTSDDDLEIIFSRFGRVKSCEVIRDKKTGDSLQYAFVEFENRKACEEAFFKMDNVLIDDRRIHVDFSQSVSKYRWKGKGRGVEERADGNDQPRNHQHAEGKHHSPETYHKREDVAQHNNITGSPQVRSAEVLQGNSRDSPDSYAERSSRKEGSRDRDRRERSRNSERDKHRSDQRTNSSDRDHRRRDDSDRGRRTGERRRESSRDRQRKSNDVDRDRHRKDRKRDSDHERSRSDRTRDSDHERSRSDRTRDSDRERSRSDRVRDVDRERSRSDRTKDSEYDRSRNSKPVEESDKSRGDKKAESKSKDVKKELEGKNTTEKEFSERMDSNNSVNRQAEKDKVNKEITSEKISPSELRKTDDKPSQSRKSEEIVTNAKTSEVTDKKQHALDKFKTSEKKQVKDVYEVKKDLERHDKEYSKEHKLKVEEKQADKLGQSDTEQISKNVRNDLERKIKLDVMENSQDIRKKRNSSDHHKEHHGSRLDKAHVKKQISESDKSDEDGGSDDESESELDKNDKKLKKTPLSRGDEKVRRQDEGTNRRKAKKGSDTEDSQGTAGEEVAVPSSKKKQREHVREDRVKLKNKRRAEQSPHTVKKKRWRKQSSSSSDSEESSSSNSSSDSSASSSDSARNSKVKLKKSSKKHSLPAKKIKKLKIIKKKKKRLRHRKHSDSDSSSESSDSSDYKRKYIKLKKKKKRKNISSDDSSSEGEARKRREKKKKSKLKKKQSTSEDSDEEGASASSDASYKKLLRKHKKRLAAEKKAKKSRRELKLNKKKSLTPRKRQYSEPEEQSSSDESEPKIVKKDSKRSNIAEGKKVRKEAVGDVSS